METSEDAPRRDPREEPSAPVGYEPERRRGPARDPNLPYDPDDPTHPEPPFDPTDPDHPEPPAVPPEEPHDPDAPGFPERPGQPGGPLIL